MNADAVLEVVKEGMAVVTAIIAELRVLLTDGAVTPEMARERIAKLRAGVAATDERIDEKLRAAEARRAAAAEAGEKLRAAEVRRSHTPRLAPSEKVRARLLEDPNANREDVLIWLDEKSDELDALDLFSSGGGHHLEESVRISALVSDGAAALEAKRIFDRAIEAAAASKTGETEKGTFDTTDDAESTDTTDEEK